MQKNHSVYFTSKITWNKCVVSLLNYSLSCFHEIFYMWELIFRFSTLWGPTRQQHAFSPMICLVRTYNRAGKCQDFNQNLGGPFCNKLQLTRAFYLLYAILNFFLHFPRVQNILFFVFAVWKNQRFTLYTGKIFREINLQRY